MLARPELLAGRNGNPQSAYAALARSFQVEKRTPSRVWSLKSASPSVALPSGLRNSGFAEAAAGDQSETGCRLNSFAFAKGLCRADG